MWARLKEDKHPHAHTYTHSQASDWRQFGFSCNSLPWAWMRKHLCVKVVPWQRFLFCDQGQHEASFERRAHWHIGRRFTTNPSTSGEIPGQQASAGFKTQCRTHSKISIHSANIKKEWCICERILQLSVSISCQIQGPYALNMCWGPKQPLQTYS